jgi:hypothetical protein
VGPKGRVHESYDYPVLQHAPLCSQRTRQDSNLRPLPPEGTEPIHGSEVIPLFPGQCEHGATHEDAPRRTELHPNAVRYRICSDAETLAFASWNVLKVV